MTTLRDEEIVTTQADGSGETDCAPCSEGLDYAEVDLANTSGLAPDDEAFDE